MTVAGNRFPMDAEKGGFVSVSVAATSMSKVMLGATVAALADGPYCVSVKLPWKAFTRIWYVVEGARPITNCPLAPPQAA